MAVNSAVRQIPVTVTPVTTVEIRLGDQIQNFLQLHNNERQYYLQYLNRYQATVVQEHVISKFNRVNQ